MDNVTATDYLEVGSEIKYEMLSEEDIKEEIFQSFAEDREVNDLKDEEYCPMDLETSIKIENVTNNGDVSDSYDIVDIKSPKYPGNMSTESSKESSVRSRHRKTKKGKSTDNKTAKSRRVRKKHVTYSCGFCAKSFAKSNDFYSHTATHSDKFKNNKESYSENYLERKCKNNKSDAGKTDIKLESDTKNNKRKRRNQSGIFQCDRCTKTFTFKANFKRHYLFHTQKRERPVCDMCKKSYNNKSYLIQHIKTVHLKTESDTVFVCDVCEQTVTTAYALRCHMQIHTGFKPFVCNVCTKGFSNKWNLKIHLKSH